MKPLKYAAINRLLRKAPDAYKDECYPSDWIYTLDRCEAVLYQLRDTELLPPNCTHDALAVWLMHEAPLTEVERNDFRHFLYSIDYY